MMMPAKREMSSLRQFNAILRKDLIRELRTKEMITSMGLYALLVLIIYYVALSNASQSFDVSQIAGGLLLLTIVFTSMLGLNRSFAMEKDQGCIEALLLSPIDRPIIFFAKAIGNLIFLLLVEVMIVPLFYFIFMGTGTVNSGPWWMVALALLVASIGIAGVGTFLASMSVNTKGQDFTLAIMFIPLMFPLLLATVGALSAVIIGEIGFEQTYWTMLSGAIAYNVITIGVAFALYEFMISA